MKKAALYLRSSKDRKDVSLDVQRRELEQLAQAKGLEIATEYSDVVESGKDESRPGYQRLCAALGDKLRGWDHLLILDTSRLARRQHIAIAFSHHCQRKGIKILYAKVPELDPINEILVLSVMRAMDEMHSHTSREKGTAGMAENVRKGFRAGGRAPLGYQLHHEAIGLVREGKPVLKSVLRTTAQAEPVGAYLTARAEGIPRAVALRDTRLKVSASTAIGMEWNALTYAGCTVWNVHRECGPEGYGDLGKRRPRSEWVIKENTHPALITREQAEKLLHQLEHSDVGKAVSAARRGLSSYLLSEVLVAPNGAMWRGMTDRSGPSYRLPAGAAGRGRVIRAQLIERGALAQLATYLADPATIDQFHAIAQGGEVDTSERRRKYAEVVGLAAKIDRAMEAALNLDDPAPFYRKIDSMERERKALVADIEDLKREEALQQAAKAISRDRIQEMVEDLAENLERAAPEEVKGLLGSFIDRIVLDPETLEVQMHFRLGADCAEVASPRGRAATAVIRHVLIMQLAA